MFRQTVIFTIAFVKLATHTFSETLLEWWWDIRHFKITFKMSRYNRTEQNKFWLKTCRSKMRYTARALSDERVSGLEYLSVFIVAIINSARSLSVRRKQHQQLTGILIFIRQRGRSWVWQWECDRIKERHWKERAEVHLMSRENFRKISLKHL